MPRCCQGCCGMCRPRWLRLVDNIYPKNCWNKQPNGPKLNSLTHYSCRNPEKLGRIAQYLEKRMQRDLYRRRTGYVFVTMDIIDNLIKSCQRLDNFICVYLGMVNSLLESKDPELQVMGTQSFEKYSEIDKETPNYLKEYADLLQRFVRMCHDNSGDEAAVARVRCAGLQGVMSIVRKIASDDLQINVWEQHYMSLIVWAILFNLEDAFRRQAEEEREIKELYDTASFEELLERHRQEKATPVNEVIALLKEADALASAGAEAATQRKAATINEIDFPSLFAF